MSLVSLCIEATERCLGRTPQPFSDHVRDRTLLAFPLSAAIRDISVTFASSVTGVPGTSGELSGSKASF